MNKEAIIKKSIQNTIAIKQKLLDDPGFFMFIEQVSEELTTIGLETIGEIDNIVNKSLNGLHKYEKEYYKDVLDARFARTSSTEFLGIKVYHFTSTINEVQNKIPTVR